MQSSITLCLTSTTWRSTVALGICLALISSAQAQDEFLIGLRDGTVLRTQINIESIPWRRIDPSGAVTSDTLRLESIRKVELALKPASRQLIEIRQHLSDLQSDNYHVRNQAEADLLQQGSQFIDVLTAARENGNAEVRYRVNRILKRLQSKDAKRIDADFDQVTLTNGEVVSGDLEFDTLQVNFEGREYPIGRYAIVQIARIPLSEPENHSDGVTATFTKPGERFYQATDTHINFDLGRLNESFNKFEDVREAFVYRGVLLKADCGADPATVVTAGFAVDQGRSRKNSAATMMTRNSKKYLGAIQIDFCQPGLRNIPANVHRVACYIALVDHPRDFVMDAFSADDQIVASAEALEKTSFIGVESTVSIAYVRIQPNRNLKLDPADQDANFVIDDLTFDVPQASAGVASADQARLVLNDGTRLVGSDIQFDGKSFVVRGGSAWALDGAAEPFSITPDKVESITLPAGQKKPSELTLWGYFLDGSQLPLEIGQNQWTVRGNPEWTVARSDLAGVYGGSKILRFPLADDLATQKTVVVNPAERWLVPEVKIDSEHVSWDQSAAELREPFKLENSKHSADSTSQFELADAPSIWWRLPAEGEPTTGWLKARDGRIFVLGGSSNIRLEKLEADSIVLRHGDEAIPIAWSDVIAVGLTSPQ